MNRAFLFFLLLSINASDEARLSRSNQSYRTNTWSIVAVDPETGDVGVAVASCVPDLRADAGAIGGEYLPMHHRDSPIAKTEMQGQRFVH